MIRARARLAAGSPADSLPPRGPAVFAAVLLLVLALGPAAVGIAVRAAPQPFVRAVDAVGITVADMTRSVDFFTRVLDFEPVSDRRVEGTPYERLLGLADVRMRVVRLRCGDEAVDLIEYLEPRGRPIPADSRSNDRWFQHIAIIVADMDRAYARLRENGVRPASVAPQRLPDWNRQAGGIRAYYFRDPDGHILEILQFPAGKGDPRWQSPARGRLYLGIDHTAIVVRDTAASLRLYRDALGLRVAGESENYGIEQERLNDVPGARLRITGLRAAAGMGIEFLEYLAPRDGRPAPADARPNDLAAWQTRLVTSDAGRAGDRLRGAGGRLVSAGRIDLGTQDGGAVLARDPDGHALLLVEPAGAPPAAGVESARR